MTYMTVRNQQDSSKLQDDLDKLASWESEWRMEFHPDKCTVLSIYRGKPKNQFVYHLHGKSLKTVDHAKYLGVTFSKDLSWNTHVDNIVSKANKRLGFLRRNLRVNNVLTKDLAYKSLVRPLVEYSSCVWDPYT